MTVTPPAIGDRAKVTFEGIWQANENGVGLAMGKSPETLMLYSSAVVGHAVAVEILPPPLPTTPGSVVRDLRPHLKNSYLTLQEDGRWYAAGTSAPTPTYGGKLDVPIQIVFDAGAK